TGGDLQRRRLDQTYGGTIYLSNFAADTLTIDLRSGGSFSLPGTIHIDGGRNGAGGQGTFRLLCGPANHVGPVSKGKGVVNAKLAITWTNVRAEFIDGGTGKDSLAVLGGDGDDVFTVDTAMIALADIQIGIAGFESVSINGGRGANTVV